MDHKMDGARSDGKDKPEHSAARKYTWHSVAG